MSFLVRPLDRDRIEHWLHLDPDTLRSRDGRWVVADASPGYPCRVSLVDAEPGERVLLFPFPHHDVSSPYASTGPIYVREHAKTADMAAGEVPLMVRHRQQSFRGYGSDSMMLATRVAMGSEFETIVAELFSNADIDYIHVHNAGPGCFNCEVQRA